MDLNSELTRIGYNPILNHYDKYVLYIRLYIRYGIPAYCIWSAHHEADDKFVEIKVAHPWLGDDKKFKVRIHIFHLHQQTYELLFQYQ